MTKSANRRAIEAELLSDGSNGETFAAERADLSVTRSRMSPASGGSSSPTRRILGCKLAALRADDPDAPRGLPSAARGRALTSAVRV